MSDQPNHVTPDDEAIKALIASDRGRADRLLREMGYSVEEWERAAHAPPAVDVASARAGASPALEPATT